MSPNYAKNVSPKYANKNTGCEGAHAIERPDLSSVLEKFTN